MYRKSDVVSFVKYLKRGMLRFGLNLKDSTDSYNQEELKNKILDEVSFKFDVSKWAIKNSTKRGVVIQARVMAIILFNEHLNMTNSEIGKYLKHTDRSLVSKRLKSFNVFKNRYNSDESQFDKIYSNDGFFEKYMIINQKIIGYKNIKNG